MHIAIVETGEPPAALKRQYPGYGAMMEAMIAPHAPAAVFSRCRLFDGEALPQSAAFDGLLITGSAAGVYEGHEWIAPLEGLIRETATARKPQFGICFGHQIMAQAFGGVVEKSDKGWGVGVHAYDVFNPAPWMDPPLGRMACAVSHQDQVTTLPPSARRLGGSAFCENGFLSYDHAPAASMQPHPEFSHDYADALLRLRRERVGEDLADEGLRTLKGRSDREAIGRWIARFYKEAR